MTFANPWGLIALLAVPAIVIIHLYHRRFPPLIVAGSHLWGAATEVRAAGRRRERLPVTATLLLELAAAVLLALILSRPRIGDAGVATHLVAVLDNSASMQAAPPGDASFRDRAVAELKRRVESPPIPREALWQWLTLGGIVVTVGLFAAAWLIRTTGPVLLAAMIFLAASAVCLWNALGGSARGEQSTVVTLILTGRRPTMLAGPGVRWDKAKTALEDWQPAAAAHDFQSAWDLASQLAEESGRLLFLTDHLPDEAVPVPAAMEIAARGEPLSNTGVAAARWTYDSVRNEGRLFLRVQNFGATGTTVAITATSKGEPVFAREVTLAGESSLPLEADLPGGLGELRIELDAAADSLSVDNIVTLIEPKVRTVSVAVTLPENQPAYEAVQRALEGVPDVQLVDEADLADLVFAAADPLPVSRDNLWWLGIGPLDDSDDARNRATTPSAAHPFLLEKQNPLLEGLVLGGVVWGGVQPLELAVTPLVSAGESTLLARLRGTQTTAYILNIDFEKTNLTESPDWPILVKNLVDLRRAALPGLRRWNYRLNEDVRFRLADRAEKPADADTEPPPLVLIHKGESRPLARSTLVELPPLEETGVYEIRDGDRSVGRFAVNFFDRRESTLTALKAGEREAAREAESSVFALDDFYTWPIMLGVCLTLLAVVGDWWVLKRP